MKIEILHSGLAIDSVSMSKRPSRAAIADIFGEPDRTISIEANRTPFRNILLFDHLGISLLEDLPEATVAAFRFFLLGDLGENVPKNTFTGQLVINSKRLVAGMKLDDLPLKGGVSLSKGIGNSWCFRSESFYVSLEMRRLKNLTGRSSGRPVLFEVSYSFLEQK